MVVARRYRRERIARASRRRVCDRRGVVRRCARARARARTRRAARGRRATRLFDCSPIRVGPSIRVVVQSSVRARIAPPVRRRRARRASHRAVLVGGGAAGESRAMQLQRGQRRAGRASRTRVVPRVRGAIRAVGRVGRRGNGADKRVCTQERAHDRHRRARSASRARGRTRRASGRISDGSLAGNPRRPGRRPVPVVRARARAALARADCGVPRGVGAVERSSRRPSGRRGRRGARCVR